MVAGDLAGSLQDEFQADIFSAKSCDGPKIWKWGLSYGGGGPYEGYSLGRYMSWSQGFLKRLLIVSCFCHNIAMIN